jgi:hypothetical protein
MCLCHVRVEGSVCEMLQARAVVRASVEGPWDVRGQVAVAVFPLVIACNLAQQGGGAKFGDRAFAVSRDGGGVVAEVFERGVAGVKEACHHV